MRQLRPHQRWRAGQEMRASLARNLYREKQRKIVCRQAFDSCPEQNDGVLLHVNVVLALVMARPYRRNELAAWRDETAAGRR